MVVCLPVKQKIKGGYRLTDWSSQSCNSSAKEILFLLTGLFWLQIHVMSTKITKRSELHIPCLKRFSNEAISQVLYFPITLSLSLSLSLYIYMCVCVCVCVCVRVCVYLKMNWSTKRFVFFKNYLFCSFCSYICVCLMLLSQWILH